MIYQPYIVKFTIYLFFSRSKERKRKLTTNHREILNNMPQNEPPNLSDKISSSDYCQSSSKTFCIRKKSAAQRTKTFNGNHLQINGSPGT